MNRQGERVRRVLHRLGVKFVDPFTHPEALAFWSDVDAGEKGRWEKPIKALREPKPHVFFLDYSFAIVLAQKREEDAGGRARGDRRGAVAVKALAASATGAAESLRVDGATSGLLSQGFRLTLVWRFRDKLGGRSHWGMNTRWLRESDDHASFTQVTSTRVDIIHTSVFTSPTDKAAAYRMTGRIRRFRPIDSAGSRACPHN
jgi:hypothetical protein